MSDLDFDALLDLENEFYQESYDAAYEVGRNHTMRDGKQFGYQTGFQRFTIVGAINRLLTLVKQYSNDNIPERKLSQLNQLIQLSDELMSHNTNSAADVSFFEDNIKTLTSKAKVLLPQLGYGDLYKDIQSLCLEATGTIPSTQINSANDMSDVW